jgi:anti-sigma factor RsiW
MTACPFSKQLEAYHDGELDPLLRQALERHLSECSECAAELAQLQGMSRMFAALPPVHLSQIGLHRLHVKADQAMDESLLRAVRVLSAVAACVLVAGSAWLFKTRGDARENMPVAPPWADVAMALDVEPSSGTYSTPAAAWYLADDSGRGQNASE